VYVDKLTAKSVCQKRLSTGMAPVPYHLYDGHATLIGGTADRAAVKTLLQSDYRHACIRSRGLPRVALYAPLCRAHDRLQICLFACPQCRRWRVTLNRGSQRRSINAWI